VPTVVITGRWTTILRTSSTLRRPPPRTGDARQRRRVVEPSPGHQRRHRQSQPRAPPGIHPRRWRRGRPRPAFAGKKKKKIVGKSPPGLFAIRRVPPQKIAVYYEWRDPAHYLYGGGPYEFPTAIKRFYGPPVLLYAGRGGAVLTAAGYGYPLRRAALTRGPTPRCPLVNPPKSLRHLGSAGPPPAARRFSFFLGLARGGTWQASRL